MVDSQLLISILSKNAKLLLPNAISSPLISFFQFKPGSSLLTLHIKQTSLAHLKWLISIPSWKDVYDSEVFISARWCRIKLYERISMKCQWSCHTFIYLLLNLPLTATIMVVRITNISSGIACPILIYQSKSNTVFNQFKNFPLRKKVTMTVCCLRIHRKHFLYFKQSYT